MLTPIIIATFAVLSLARCESVELVFLRSAHRFGSTTERDFFFKGTVCGAPLQWFVNGDSYGGFEDSRMVQDVYTRDDTQGSQPGQNVRYMGILLDKTRNEDGDVCFTSLLIVYKPQLEEVVCRGLLKMKRITEFNISLTNEKKTGNVKFDYIFSHEVQFTGMPKYMHVLLCKVLSGESLSVAVNGNHVKTFNEMNGLGADRLEPHGTDVISDSVLLSNRPSPENSLTAITLVFVEDMEEIFSVLCQAVESGESLSFNLPLHSSQTSTGMDRSTSDTTMGDVSSDSDPTSSSDSIVDTPNSDNSIPSNEKKDNDSTISSAVVVPFFVIFIVVILIAVILYKNWHRIKPICMNIVGIKQSIKAGKRDGVDYLNDVHGSGDTSPPEEESNRKFNKAVEQAREDDLDDSRIAIILPAAEEHMNDAEDDVDNRHLPEKESGSYEVNEGHDEVDGVGAGQYLAEKENDSDEVDGVDVHAIEENESSPGLLDTLTLRKRRNI